MAEYADINAVGKEVQSSDNVAPSDKQTLINMILGMMDEGKKSRARYDTDWDMYWDFYHDKQWNSEKRAAHRAKPVINICRQTIQAQLPILTDNKPGFDVIPPEPQDADFADKLSKITQHWWEHYQNDGVVIDGLLDAMVADVGVWKVIWDEELEGGAGDVKMTAIDPKDVWVNRDATDFRREDGWKWTIHRMYKTVGCLKLMYPDKADQIAPDGSGESKSKNEDTSNTTVTLVSPIDKREDTGTKPPVSSGDDRKTAEVWEIWMDDDTLEEYTETNESGEEVTAAKKKYPAGRLITFMPNKKLILQDAENPYKHRECPFSKVVDNNLPRSYAGEGEVRTLIEIQRLLNKTTANIVDYQTIMSNAIWKVKSGSTDNPEMITNRAGLIILINEGYDLNDIQREIPPALPANATEFYNVMWDTANKLTGLSEISQGRRTQGDPTAGYAITQLQEAAQTRIRLKERNLQRGLAQVGKQVISLMMQYYKAPRVARITGEQGWPEYFEYFVEETQDGKYLINSKDYNRTEDGQYVPQPTYQQSAPTTGIFDVKIMAGSSLPYAKAQRTNTAFKLFEMGIIDDEEVLNSFEWPNKEQVLSRVREKQQAAAEAQAQEQAQLPPPKR